MQAKEDAMSEERAMREMALEGSLALVKPAWHHLTPGSDHAAGELYQTSLNSIAGGDL